MKLKLHGNSIRLRLTRPEVARFAEDGRLEDGFEYAAGGRLAYGVEAADLAGEIGVRVDQTGVFIVLPGSVARDWTGSEKVGVSGEFIRGDGGRVAILVEKEFRRLHGANNDPDLYPNPLEADTAPGAGPRAPASVT